MHEIILQIAVIIAAFLILVVGWIIHPYTVGGFTRWIQSPMQQFFARVGSAVGPALLVVIFGYAYIKENKQQSLKFDEKDIISSSPNGQILIVNPSSNARSAPYMPKSPLDDITNSNIDILISKILNVYGYSECETYQNRLNYISNFYEQERTISYSLRQITSLKDEELINTEILKKKMEINDFSIFCALLQIERGVSGFPKVLDPISKVFNNSGIDPFEVAKCLFSELDPRKFIHNIMLESDPSISKIIKLKGMGLEEVSKLIDDQDYPSLCAYLLTSSEFDTTENRLYEWNVRTVYLAAESLAKKEFFIQVCSSVDESIWRYLEWCSFPLSGIHYDGDVVRKKFDKLRPSKNVVSIWRPVEGPIFCYQSNIFKGVELRRPLDILKKELEIQLKMGEIEPNKINLIIAEKQIEILRDNITKILKNKITDGIPNTISNQNQSTLRKIHNQNDIKIKSKASVSEDPDTLPEQDHDSPMRLRAATVEKSSHLDAESLKQEFDANILPITPKTKFEQAREYETSEASHNDLAKAFILYEELALQGNIDASFRSGILLESGKGCEKNEKQAHNRYKDAARRGHAGAQVNLGLMYAQGRGVRQDDSEALKWYLMAAENNDIDGQVLSGMMYQYGFGAEIDLKEAARFYRMASDQGDAEAKQLLESIRGSF